MSLLWLFLHSNRVMLMNRNNLFTAGFFFLLIIITAMSCSNQPSVPRGFPKEKEMASILADLYLAEATMNSYPYSYRENLDSKSPAFYKYVLEKHNLSKEQFDTIFAWYTAQPYLYSKVYDRVISILGTREAELKNALLKEDSLQKISQENERLRMERDNLWNGAMVVNLPKRDTVSTVVSFSASLDSVKGGVLKLEARYRFGKENQISSAAMLMMVCYSDSTRDTARYHLDRSFNSKMNLLVLKLSDSLKAVSVKGSLLEYDTLKKVSVEINDIKLSYQPADMPHSLKMMTIEDR